MVAFTAVVVLAANCGVVDVDFGAVAVFDVGDKLVEDRGSAAIPDSVLVSTAKD